MAQKLIILEPETYYHIYNRGNNREHIFKEAKNYLYFMNLFEKYVLPVADLFAYNLLPNHFFIRTKKLPNGKSSNYYSQAFSNLFNAYTKAINKAYNRTGSLFQERFKRKKIDSDSYFTAIIFYIHCNAQHHGLVTNFIKYPYTSYHNFINGTYEKLHKQEVIEWFGGIENFIRYHKEYSYKLLEKDKFLENSDDD